LRTTESVNTVHYYEYLNSNIGNVVHNALNPQSAVSDGTPLPDVTHRRSPWH